MFATYLLIFVLKVQLYLFVFILAKFVAFLHFWALWFFLLGLATYGASFALWGFFLDRLGLFFLVGVRLKHMFETYICNM